MLYLVVNWSHHLVGWRHWSSGANSASCWWQRGHHRACSLCPASSDIPPPGCWDGPERCAPSLWPACGGQTTASSIPLATDQGKRLHVFFRLNNTLLELPCFYAAQYIVSTLTLRCAPVQCWYCRTHDARWGIFTLIRYNCIFHDYSCLFILILFTIHYID